MHGNPLSYSRIVHEFRLYWKLKQTGKLPKLAGPYKDVSEERLKATLCEYIVGFDQQEKTGFVKEKK